MTARRFAVPWLAAFLVTAGVAYGTTVRRMDMSELARHSALIVRGTVIANEVASDEGANGPTNVRTITTIGVDQTLKGKNALTLEVVGLGGEVDGLRFNWPGVPRFEQGEEVILFLQKTPAGGTTLPGLRPGDLTVVGMGQGSLNIVDDEVRGKVVKQSLREINVVGEANAIQGPMNKGLDEVVREIANVVESQQNSDE